MDRPAGAPQFEHLVLCDPATQRRQVEHLAGLDHHRLKP